MKVQSTRFLLVLMMTLAVSCGNKKPDAKGGGDAKPDGEAAQKAEGEKETGEAKSQITNWLGKEAAEKISQLGGDLSKELGLKISNDEKVKAEIGKLTSKILKDKSVKKKTDKIADKATSGFLNKVKLGWKAIQAGGVDEYKKKVKEKTTRIAMEVISEHLDNEVMKDPRMAELIKGFVPILQLQAKITAISLTDNLSPVASKKILGIALTLSVTGKSNETGKKVEAWIQECDGHVEVQIEKLFRGIADLKSVETALQGVVVRVVAHDRTKTEFVTMMSNIMKDKNANKAMIKAYENTAFDKSEKAIRASIEKIVKLPVVDNELFAALERLTTAPGANGIMEKEMAGIGEDPEMAKLVDDFVVGLLDTCGDPIK